MPKPTARPCSPGNASRWVLAAAATSSAAFRASCSIPASPRGLSHLGSNHHRTGSPQSRAWLSLPCALRHPLLRPAQPWHGMLRPPVPCREFPSFLPWKAAGCAPRAHPHRFPAASFRVPTGTQHQQGPGSPRSCALSQGLTPVGTPLDCIPAHLTRRVWKETDPAARCGVLSLPPPQRRCPTHAIRGKAGLCAGGRRWNGTALHRLRPVLHPLPPGSAPCWRGAELRARRCPTQLRMEPCTGNHDNRTCERQSQDLG